MKDIYIKAWFGDWKKTTLQQAVAFFKGLKNGASSSNAFQKHFNDHFKGISYDEMIKVVKETNDY